MSASQFAKVIAESSSSGSEWSLVDGNTVVAHAMISSINPYFRTRREISHIIRLELPREFFKRRWDKVLFYGAGCSTPERKKIVESSLVAQFKTPVIVESDLVGAAHGLLQHDAGLACILGTGSNSCFYDGERITKSVTSGGFILGDEGSGSAMGRIFLSDVLKDLAPRELIEEFYAVNKTNSAGIMDAVYNNPHANHNLHNFSFFLADHLDKEYAHNLVTNEIKRFFDRNLRQYNYKDYPVCFVGSVATRYSEILLQVAYAYNVNVKKIVSDSMPGLVAYHSVNFRTNQ
jgi:N-acetylglucosamine kinase-like BadF-type ATPase